MDFWGLSIYDLFKLVEPVVYYGPENFRYTLRSDDEKRVIIQMCHEIVGENKLKEELRRIREEYWSLDRLILLG